MKLDSAPHWPEGTLHVRGICTNLTINKTLRGEYQVVRVLKPGGPTEGDFLVLFASESEEECRAFQRAQVRDEFPGLLR